ncbi:hypothetical protein ACFL2Q_01705 [Thermodesulfobacteriota bacterium]
MKLSQHSVAGGPLAVGVYAATYSWSSVLFAVASSVLMDLDHLPDYLYFRRGWHGTGDFFEVCHKGRLVKTFLVFYAWEWPLIIGASTLIGVGSSWLWPIGLGVFYHLAWDALTNPVPASFYWILRRAFHGFRLAGFHLRAGAVR